MDLLSSSRLASRLAVVAQPDYTSVDVFWASHPRWPLPPGSRNTSSNSGHGKTTKTEEEADEEEEIHIGIFDSSFNPPTLAHFEIAGTSFPSAHPESSSTTTDSSATSSSASTSSSCGNNAIDSKRTGKGHGNDKSRQGRGGYTAKLLLLSARNVDKPPTHLGDEDKEGQKEQERKVRENATAVERVEMMVLQARRMAAASSLPMEEQNRNDEQEEESSSNIAVAVLNFPTFVGKSRIIHSWLDQTLPGLLQDLKPESISPARTPKVRLSFLIGSDTLTRLFRPAYYPPSSSFPEIGPDMETQLKYFFEQDRSRIVCVRRYLKPGEREEEERFVREDDGCKQWVKSGGIRFVEESETAGETGAGAGVKSGEEMGLISSTLIRQRVDQVRQEMQGPDDNPEEPTVKALEGLCIDDVSRYIARKGLYLRSSYRS
jgi:nicotinamide-nucleotide adenylyltransferase